MNTLREELICIRDTLTANQLECAVCGGIAVAMYGNPRPTFDIDLLIPPEIFQDVTACLTSLGFGNLTEYPFLAHQDTRRIYTMHKEDVELDLLVLTEQTRWIWETRKRFVWEGGIIALPSPQGMIFLKELRGYDEDLRDIAYLRTIVLDENETDTPTD